MFQEDEFSQRFSSSFDDVLAPVISTLDNIHAYLDPNLTPADFLEWLAGWVGAVLDENWPLERQRTFVAEAVELYRWRGTVKGLSALVALYAGVEPEIVDTGGVTWSAVPNGAVPGEPEPRFTIRLRVPDRSAVGVDRLDGIVRAAKPAHVTHQIELTGPGRESPRETPQEPPKGEGPETPKAEPEQRPPAKPTEEQEESPKAEAPQVSGDRTASPKNGNRGAAKASEGQQAKEEPKSPDAEGEVPAE